MNNNASDISILVPAAIATLPLTISEKIALVRIDANPFCRNGDLARELGFTERGVNKLLQRLKTAGYLQQFRRGRARKLLLRFHVEQRTEFLKTENAASSSNQEHCSSIAVARKATAVSCAEIPLDQCFEQTMRTIDQITRSQDFYPESIVRLLQPLIARIEVEVEHGPVKEKILRELMVRQGAFLAIALGAGLPKKVQRKIDELISNATQDQLIKFRERALTGNLVGTVPLLLAELEQPPPAESEFGEHVTELTQAP